MLRILLTYFWPVLIPLVLYTLWFIWARRQEEEGKDPLEWTDGPWAMTLIVTLLVAILCFIPVIKNKTVHKDSYQPAQFKDGKLIPGKIE